MKPVILQKLPHPFKAALSICSDIDGTSFDTFVELHRFLNTRQQTSLGQGLALPIGNSFWMYDHPENDDTAFSYFSSDNKSPSKNAPMIRDFIQSGILDVLHTYGNYSSKHLFSRELAVRAIDELERLNCHVRVWTNHGGEFNPQKIGRRSGGTGDVNHSNQNPVYHSDLLHAYGIRFFWDSEGSLTHVAGQERQVSRSEAFWKSPLQRNPIMKMKSFLKSILEGTDTIIHKINNQHVLPWSTWNSENSLLNIRELRDGHQMYHFIRFGHGRYDWSDDLSYLLNNQILEVLLKKGGILILYIHLGDLKNSSDKMLHDSTIKKLKQISSLYHDQKIWVGTTSQLLLYKAVTQSLDWEVEETDMLYIITILGLKEQALLNTLNVKDLQGITFQAPTDKEVILKFNQKVIPAETVLDEDHQWVKIPIKNIEWPLD